MLVQTIKGDIEHTELRVVDRIWFEGNSRNIHTEWYYGDELVRSDGIAQVLKAQPISGEQQGV